MALAYQILEEISNDRRLSLLIMQLKLAHNPALEFEKQSNESVFRICWYIYKHTDNHLIDFVKAETLYDYILHQVKNSEEIGFITAVKDVKNFLRFLKKNHYHVPDVDLSTLNVELWCRL